MQSSFPTETDRVSLRIKERREGERRVSCKRVCTAMIVHLSDTQINARRTYGGGTGGVPPLLLLLLLLFCRLALA